MSKVNILFLGATGYLGGTVFQRLLKHPKASSFNITALVRSKDKAEIIKSLNIGVETVIGSNDDSAKLEELSSKSDYVFSISDSDNMAAMKAVLTGLQKRFEATGIRPVLIHTSGTAIVMDDARGMFTYETIYDDTNADQIATVADTQLHRDVDLVIESADKAGYVYTYSIVPGTIYGLASGRFVQLGIQNSHSIQIPLLVRAGIARGHAGMVGKGVNLWPNAHVEDVADLFVVLYDYVASHNKDTTGHGYTGYYFAENGEHNLYDVSKAIQVAFNELGVGAAQAEPDSFTDEECVKYFGGYFMGSNSRCVANKSRAIGWKPVHTTADMLASIKPEVEALLKKA